MVWKLIVAAAGFVVAAKISGGEPNFEFFFTWALVYLFASPLFGRRRRAAGSAARMAASGAKPKSRVRRRSMRRGFVDSMGSTVTDGIAGVLIPRKPTQAEIEAQRRRAQAKKDFAFHDYNARKYAGTRDGAYHENMARKARHDMR